MGRKRTPGLFKRGRIWHIDKAFRGCRIRESTGTGDLKEAEEYLARKMDQMRQAVIYGVRPKRSFKLAAMQFLQGHQHKRSIVTDAKSLNQVMPFIGQLPLESIHMGTLQPFVEARKAQGVKNSSINITLAAVRRILNLAASEWRDENDLTWLLVAPKIRMEPTTDARKPYPLSWDEQNTLFQELPDHLVRMALFAVNTGLRDSEVCGLRWEWEVKEPELNASVFIIPQERNKGGQERLVVLNQVAKSVVDECRGVHPTHVFTYDRHPIRTMNNSAWQKARKRVGLTQVRVHDLRHTYGRRLRSAGVSFEDRQDLLGHKSKRITTHYSQAEIKNLIQASGNICAEPGNPHKIPTLVVLRGARE